VDIKPYLPAMFNVRVKDVYEILGMSHHTLAPLRRDLGLASWPFSEVCRGEFRMAGVLTTWDDIDRLRQTMMVGADDRIVKILQTMGERAAKFKHLANKVVMSRQAREAAARMTMAFRAAGVLNIPPPAIIALASKKDEKKPPASSTKKTDARTAAEEEFPDNSETERIANLVFPDAGGYNWEGLGELLLRHLEASHGALFPEIDEEQW
jgi:hypothetical protein